MNLNYQIMRLKVRMRINRRNRRLRNVVKKMDAKQLTTFNSIGDIAEKYRESIRFDPDIDETTIRMPNVLLIIRPYKILTKNTHGFNTLEFSNDAYELMMKKIKREAHRDRRKIKYDFDRNELEFIKSVYVPETTETPYIEPVVDEFADLEAVMVELSPDVVEDEVVENNLEETEG